MRVKFIRRSLYGLMKNFFSFVRKHKKKIGAATFSILIAVGSGLVTSILYLNKMKTASEHLQAFGNFMKKLADGVHKLATNQTAFFTLPYYISGTVLTLLGIIVSTIGKYIGKSFNIWIPAFGVLGAMVGNLFVYIQSWFSAPADKIEEESEKVDDIGDNIIIKYYLNSGKKPPVSLAPKETEKREKFDKLVPKKNPSSFDIIISYPFSAFGWTLKFTSYLMKIFSWILRNTVLLVIIGIIIKWRID